MRAVILAGGLGTRLREETDVKPKPMVEIAGKPILWHLMRNLSGFDMKDFVVCGGYKVNVIKDYFLNYSRLNNNVAIDLSIPDSYTVLDDSEPLNWKVLVADTGPLTNTGGRIKKIQSYVNGETFFCTYGDGLSDVNISDLLKFHKSHGKIATVTVAKAQSRFGLVDFANDGTVVGFHEKPQLDAWVNIGFFIFEPRIFDYLLDESVLEQEPLQQLTNAGELVAFKHEGFWQPMDTYREMVILNSLWENGLAPWKNW